MQSSSGIKRGRSPSPPARLAREQVEETIVNALERGEDEEAAELIEAADLTRLQLCTGVLALTRLLASGRCPTLVQLDLGGEALADDDGAADRLATILPTLRLQSLSIEDCGCTQQQLAALVRALKSHPSLLGLHIDSSSAEDESAPWLGSLADVLPTLPTLQRLSLAGCDLTPRGVALLASALGDGGVRELRLCGGTPDAQHPLVEALEHELHMHVVELLSPLVSQHDDFRRRINRAIAAGRVSHLTLDSWLLKPEHLPDLCEALRRGMTVIGLSEHGVGPVAQHEVQLLLLENRQRRSMAILSAFMASLGQPPRALMPVGDHLAPFEQLSLARINRSTYEASQNVRRTLTRHRLTLPNSNG